MKLQTMPQGQQAASVSLNKLGDVLYLRGDVRGAREQYALSLAARRRILETVEKADGAPNGGPGDAAHSPPSAGSVQLDVATSLGKLADAEQVRGWLLAGHPNPQTPSPDP